MKKFITIVCLSLVLALAPQVFAQEKDLTKNTEKAVNSDTDKIDPAKQAKELMLMARKAKSEKPLSEVKDIKITSVVELVFSGNDFEVSNETSIKFPNKSLTIINGPFGEIKNSYDGNIAWAVTPGGIQEMVGDNAVEFENALAGDPLSILKNFDQENHKVTFLEEICFEGQMVNVILFTTNTGHEIKIYLDQKTNMIASKSFQSKAAGLTVVNEEVYSDFQKFEGVQIPMKRVIKRNGQPFANVGVKEVKINSGIDDKIFVKPQ
ncbi:MAG: hypothetical protein FD167_1710 [bacterium]|nr:MAG: hypothetical protein FD167_1710 [bacterium]